jgi:hypothetical protein
MESKFSKIENREEWQKLLDKALFKTFFHDLKWEELLESQFKWLKFERYLYKDQALLSLARVGDKLVSHPFCEYGGPLPLIKKIDFKEFQDDLLSELKDKIKISFHPQVLKFFEGAVDGGKSERVSYFLEGQPDFKKSVRYEIKKAEERGIQVKECENKEELESFYRIYLKSAKKHKVPAYPISFFKYFLESADSKITLALLENKVIAGSAFLFCDNFIHYFQNAADEGYKKTGANYLILQKEIQNKGDKIFDFGGTRRGSSLEVFKKAWGAEEHPILEMSNYSTGSSFKKSKLRSVYGVLPLFLIKIISPRLLKYKL